jgi:hypothetical protein
VLTGTRHVKASGDRRRGTIELPHQSTLKGAVMKRAVIRTMSSLLLALTLPTAGAQSAAVVITELHVHAGLTCMPKPGDAAKLAYSLTEGIRNTSTTATATVFCPVDTVPSKQADYVGTPQAVRVFVFDRSTSANISCALRVVLENNGIVLSTTYPVKSSAGSTSGPQMLQWAATDGTFGFANATYRVSCTLPKASGSSQSGVQQTEVEVFKILVVN